MTCLTLLWWPRNGARNRQLGAAWPPTVATQIIRYWVKNQEIAQGSRFEVRALGPNLGPNLPATGWDRAVRGSTVSLAQRWKCTLIGTQQDCVR